VFSDICQHKFFAALEQGEEAAEFLRGPPPALEEERQINRLISPFRWRNSLLLRRNSTFCREARLSARASQLFESEAPYFGTQSQTLVAESGIPAWNLVLPE
jgi:hypothetical protein